MIISATDRFLFKNMATILLTSDKNKVELDGSIDKMNQHLDDAKIDPDDPDYIRVTQTNELTSVVNTLFSNIFIDCGDVWENISATAKFSIIISTVWTKCFNSLWKVRIAVLNENEGIKLPRVGREDLALGVREYEDRPLKALEQSISRCFQRATITGLAQHRNDLTDIEMSEPQFNENAKNGISESKENTSEEMEHTSTNNNESYGNSPEYAEIQQRIIHTEERNTQLERQLISMNEDLSRLTTQTAGIEKLNVQIKNILGLQQFLPEQHENTSSNVEFLKAFINKMFSMYKQCEKQLSEQQSKITKTEEALVTAESKTASLLEQVEILNDMKNNIITYLHKDCSDLIEEHQFTALTVENLKPFITIMHQRMDQLKRYLTQREARIDEMTETLAEICREEQLPILYTPSAPSNLY